MSQGSGEFYWGQTAGILSMMFNTSRDPKKEKARFPDFFNPYVDKERKNKGKIITDFGEIKHLFVDEGEGAK